MTLLSKYAAEVVVYTFDSSLDQALSADTLTGTPTFTYLPNDSTLLFAAPSVALAGFGTTALISGGTPGTTYHILSTCSTADGQIVCCPGNLTINASC